MQIGLTISPAKFSGPKVPPVPRPEITTFLPGAPEDFLVGSEQPAKSILIGDPLDLNQRYCIYFVRDGEVQPTVPQATSYSSCDVSALADSSQVAAALAGVIGGGCDVNGDLITWTTPTNANIPDAVSIDAPVSITVLQQGQA